MAGKSKAEREALERQNAAIMAVFERAGFDHVAPDIIQPADIFLERSGEDIRARTFVFTDPGGVEMCLRPDLTVPACRYHMSHAADLGAEARYCYCGPAFRYPDERLSPQEFTQAGLEWFAASDPVLAEARVLKLAISALEASGLSGLKITIGDLGLFSGLLDDIDMPSRWRRRLRHQFWRPQAFRDLLHRFSAGAGGSRTSTSPFVDALPAENSADFVQSKLEDLKLPLVGGRSAEEIAERLAEKQADRTEAPLERQKAETIESYLSIDGSATESLEALRSIAGGKAYARALDWYERRLDLMEDQGLNPRRFRFLAGFGREIEYYTGFTFQIEVETDHGLVAVAGGGRYDDLLSDMGAQTPVPAVGLAIHTDRLKTVLG